MPRPARRSRLVAPSIHKERSREVEAASKRIAKKHPFNTEDHAVVKDNIVIMVGNKKDTQNFFKKKGGTKAGYEWVYSPSCKVGQPYRSVGPVQKLPEVVDIFRKNGDLQAKLKDGSILGMTQLVMLHHADGVKFEINGKLYLDKRSTESKVKFTVAERQRQIELDRKALAELATAQRVAEQNRTEPVVRETQKRHKPQRSDVMSVTTEKPTKKATKSSKPAKAEKKGAKTSKTAKPAKKEGAKSSGDLSPNQVLILQALKDGRPRTRAELSEKTGIKKGFSKLLGTQEGGHPDALEPKGYVKSSPPEEGERGMTYTITAKGKAALSKA